MANRPIERGATADRVAGNIREVRHERELDLAGLSARLTAHGHPIGLNTLSKIERGSRRVDVDDLMALALALDVTPNRLLLTATAVDDATIVLTGEMVVTTRAAWGWASGTSMLPTGAADDETVGLDVDVLTQFTRENRPHDPPATTFADLQGHQQQLVTVMNAVGKAERAGLSYRAIRDWLDLQDSLEQARRVMESSGHSDGEDDHGKH